MKRERNREARLPSPTEIRIRPDLLITHRKSFPGGIDAYQTPKTRQVLSKKILNP